MIMFARNRCLRKFIADACNIADFYLHKVEVFSNNALVELSLDNNFINDKGAKVLLKILRQNQKIHKLSLRKNCISLKTPKNSNKL